MTIIAEWIFEFLWSKDLQERYTDIADSLITLARKQGADDAEVVCVRAQALSFDQRLGKPEEGISSEQSDLGLRVIIGGRQAVVSSSDFSLEAQAKLLERALDMARIVPVDPYCGPADEAQLGEPYGGDLQTVDASEPTPEELQHRAAATEAAALEVKGITNSEGASAAWEKSESLIASSNGFRFYEVSTSHSISLSVIAGRGGNMQSAYDYSVRTFAEDLQSAEELGHSAADKALAKMNPGKVKSGEYPVLFDPLVSASLIRICVAAANGSAIARGTSFLKECLHTQIMPSDINIIDDPHMPRGLGSASIDAEGIANRKAAIVEGGVLKFWLLDLASARQLNLSPNGYASRGIASLPSPSASNLYLQAGSVSRADLIGSVKSGFLVTELMGMGVNGITGDYSQGAAGFWIENGEIAYPVSEVTIASNLKDMYKDMQVANDLEFRRRVNAPTVMIAKMTVAGL